MSNPIHKWQTREEYPVKFMFDEPKGPYKDQFNPQKQQWMHSVEIDGEPMVFYASETLQGEIERFGCKKGGVYYFCKGEDEQGNWIGWMIGEKPMDEKDPTRFARRQIEMIERMPSDSITRIPSEQKPRMPSTETSIVSDEDSKWNLINRKRRCEIAHGQAFNLAIHSITIALPNQCVEDVSEFMRKVNSLASEIYPYLLKEANDPWVEEEEDEDALPF